MCTPSLFDPNLGGKEWAKTPSPHESARRIRAILDRPSPIASATEAATAAPPSEHAASLATHLHQGLSPSPPDDADRPDYGLAPLPFPDRRPQAPLDPPRVEPLFFGTISQGLDQGRRLPSIRVWLVSGVVAGLTILALALPFPLPSDASNRSQTAPSPNLRSVQAATSSRSFDASPGLPANPQPHRAAAAAFAVEHISLSVKQAAWISACADGKEMFQTMVSPGNTPAFEFATRAVLRIGNAGGVDVAVNGAAIGRVGSEGEIRILEFTHGGFRLLRLPPEATPNDCDLR
jgi:RodZ C-terminal domain